MLAFRLHNISRDEGARACKVRLFFVGQLLLSSGVFCEGPQVDQASVYSFEYFLTRRNCRPYSLVLAGPYRSLVPRSVPPPPWLSKMS